MEDAPENAAGASSARRTYLEAHELVSLWWGACRGRPRALRRLLGARRSGRIGSLSALVLAALACPELAGLLVAAAAHVLLAEVGRRVIGAVDLSPRQWLRLANWTCLAPLAVAAVARGLFGGPALAGALAALVVGHALLASHLRRGLD